MMSVTILGPVQISGCPLPLYSFLVPAGFPSPAQDHIERQVSLDQLLDLRTPHTYLARTEGDSMIDAGIHSGDLLVVDRSRTPVLGDIVIAAINAEPLVKRLGDQQGQVVLLSENPRYPPRHLLEGDELLIWGVVRFSVRCHDRS